MAVVEFNKNDLFNLIGKKLTKKELSERLPMMGCPLEDIRPKTVLFEIFPDRPDMLSIEGFAREARKFLGIEKGMTKYKTREGNIEVKVEDSVKNIRPQIVCGVLRDIVLTDETITSLIQVQEKLHKTVGRNRKKVAIGVHDLDQITPPFTYKAVVPEEIEFIPLDMDKKLNLTQILKKHPKGQEYAWTLKDKEKLPIITDKNDNVLSFPPIINGELTRVTKETKNLFLDITGTNKKAINQILNILVTSFYERNCTIERVKVSNKKYPQLEPTEIEPNIQYINKLLDMDLSAKELNKLLARMGMAIEKNKILIPPYRSDVMHLIDIVEDVAISHGYENFEPRIPQIPTMGKRLPSNEILETIRQILIGTNHQEVVTQILSNAGKEFTKMGIKKEELCETKNPANKNCSACRKRLLPSLLDVLSKNKHRSFPQNIFELGKVILAGEKEETKSKDVTKLCVCISHNSAGYENITSVLETLLTQLGINYGLKRTTHKSFIAGRAANIITDKKRVGIIGEIHPRVLENFSLQKPVTSFELDIGKLTGHTNH